MITFLKILFITVVFLSPIFSHAEQSLTITCPSGQQAFFWVVPWENNGVWYYVKCEGIKSTLKDDNVVATEQPTTDK
jgi:hypothetical protein